MTLMLTNSSMDNFENQLSFLSNEVETVLAEAEQLLQDISGRNTSNSSNNMDDTVPFTPPIARTNNEEDSGSDVEEIVHEIPVIELLDSVVDVGPRNSTNSNRNHDAGHDSQDDDIIFVQQTTNENPVTIDLCDESYIGPVHSTPNPSSRRRRAQSPIGAVLVPDEIPERRPRVQTPTPQQYETLPLLTPQQYETLPLLTSRPNNVLVKQPDLDTSTHLNNSIPYKCAICLESAKSKEPMSTLCGHIFCKSCITQCIRLTQQCPMCKKKVTAKNIHRIYLT